MTLLIQYTLIFASVLMLVALGGCFAERSGVINIGLEGIMVIGALGGALVLKFMPVTVGAPVMVITTVIVSALFGMIFSLLLAVAAINFKADQTITGTAMNMLATAAATVAVKAMNTAASGGNDVSSDISYTRTKDLLLVHVGGFELNWFMLVAVLCLIAAYVALYKTRFGLRLRACGEHPQAADSVGINVYKMRYAGVLISGALGLLLSTIGMDPMEGAQRFMFGQASLYEGINTTCALIGLFSMSQVLILAEKKIKQRAKAAKFSDKIALSGKEIKRITPTILRSWIIGNLIGILPGAGASIACFLGYNTSRQFSHHKEEFGKGSIEGVAGSEAANNAVTGGSLIPMLTLGVPGDGATAILMGAFMLHGMVPGPSLFAEQGNVLYAIMLGLLVVNVFMYIVGTGLTRFYAHITRIPYEILAPIVLTFCIAGSYSTNNRIYDIYIILIFGIVSYFLRRMGFQLVPILLGIVLGPLAEKNFRRAMVISEGSFSIFFTRPISCAFILIAIVSVAIFGIRNYKSRKLAKQNTAETSERK